MADPTLSSPHHHLFLRRGKCAGLESSSSHSSPHPRLPRPQMTVCTHCKARHWECERTKSTGHFSTLLAGQGSDSGQLLRPTTFNAQSYNNALSFTSLAAHFDQTRPGTQGPRPRMFRVFPANFAKTWLICPAEAIDTQLGPDGADSRIQRSTLTKLDSMLGTGHRFVVREMGPAPLSNTWPGPTYPQPSYVEHGNGDAYLRFRHQDYQVVSSLHPSAMPLRYPLLFPAGEDDFLPNIPLCSSNQAGSPLADEEDEDEEEGDEENGDGELSRSQFFAYYLHKRDEYFSIPHCTQRAFLVFVMTDTPRSRPIDSTYLQLDQENLHLTTGQGIISLTSDQVGCSVILGSTFKNRPRENTQRYQDAMTCVVKYGKPSLFITVTCNPEWPEIKAALGPNDQACNRPDLIARVFEAKLNRLCDNGFGNKQRAGCLGDEWRAVSLLDFVVCFLNLC
ncbi:BZ3500_MvSof-1268-A1-R1_Chr3-3g06449 [Microbotryum saponariae]|uniref:BZ3500_MvSof-1268-A1-R1_Chr3-3g06449 protein n=1 Tax=Microbotryum saponariae TaxID=289078 RepID=A0A2X0KZH0_9BASI|nr:BZ3500_MvSof-1268-A1-R1_Chr3-3g06449 [Microbotryum saponariae]SDA04416.1 BZ3501_MvSof-1269-A2-R1_Chr3-2g06136 [Microbotryum saponariae]